MITQYIISLQKEELNKNLIVNLYDNYNFLKYTEMKDKNNIIELEKHNYGIVDKNIYETKFLLYVDFAKKHIR